MLAHFGTSFFKRIGVRFRGSTSEAAARLNKVFAIALVDPQQYARLGLDVLL
jgi:hypothetical protein